MSHITNTHCHCRTTTTATDDDKPHHRPDTNRPGTSTMAIHPATSSLSSLVRYEILNTLPTQLTMLMTTHNNTSPWTMTNLTSTYQCMPPQCLATWLGLDAWHTGRLLHHDALMPPTPTYQCKPSNMPCSCRHTNSPVQPYNPQCFTTHATCHLIMQQQHPSTPAQLPPLQHRFP